MLFNATPPLSYVTVHLRIGTPHQVLNGMFGTTSAPVFLENVACDGGEQTLLDCPRGSRLGLISESCACTTFEDCVEDLGIICPGLLNISQYITLSNVVVLLHSCIFIQLSQ